MKKNIIIVIAAVSFLFTTNSYGQQDAIPGTFSFNNLSSSVQILRPTINQANVYDPESPYGNVLLFENWENNGVLQLSNGEVYTINNINIDTRDNTIVSKFGEDSVYTFDPNGLKRVSINMRNFESVFIPQTKGMRVVEIIFDFNDVVLYKDFYSEMLEGNTNPIKGRIEKNKMIKKANYYISKNDQIEKIRLSKKNILKLFPDNKSEIQQYTKSKGLSFNDEEELKRIVYFASEL